MQLLKRSLVLIGAALLVVGAAPPAHAADPSDTTLVDQEATGKEVGVGPGRVATTNNTDVGPKAVRRPLTQGVPPVVGAPTVLGSANEWGEFIRPPGTVIEQDGRRTAWRDGGVEGWLHLATEGGTTVRIPFPESRLTNRGPWGFGLTLSGSRLLWTSVQLPVGDVPSAPQPRNAYLYDVRTGANTLLGTTNGSDFALWGNYLVRALPNGSITRKDLSTGSVVTVKAPGGSVRNVDVQGSWVAWTLCTNTACTSTDVSYRNLNASAPAFSLPTTGTTTVRLTNNFLYYTADETGVVRRLALGTTSPVDTGTKVRGEDIFAPTGDIHVHDETLAWVGDDGRARVTSQPAFSARPRFLGGSLGAAGFTPNGDGKADTWPVEFPLSKPLPTCAITIRLGTTVVRTLNCANTNGAAAATWNGRNTAGSLVAKGRYTWTLTGSDADGALLLWNGSGTAYSGTVTVS